MANSKQKGIILSLGSVNADFQVRVDEQPGSTTTMLSHDFMRLSGGKAANVAFLACKLGASAKLIARVGKDDLQEQALKPLEEAGIDISAVRKVAGASTAVSMIFVPPDGKKYIILAPNANDAWKKEEAEEVKKLIDEAPEASVLVVDYEIPAFIVAQAVEAAHKRGFAIILDPSPAQRADKDLFSKISYIVPDASETEELTGIKPTDKESAVRAAKKLLKLGIKTALVKLEDGGCVAANEETMLHVPPVSVEVVDTTGAGDAFAGALATAILEQRSLKEAACYATAASVAAVTAFGSQPAYPSRERLEEFYNKVTNKCSPIHEQ